MVAPLTITAPDPSGVIGAALAAVREDGETMRDVSFFMFDLIERRLDAGSFNRPPLKPETLAWKRRKGYPDKMMTASGTLRRNLRRKYSKKNHSATVKRGRREEYGFFLQYGSGRNEKTEWMFMDPDDREGALRIYRDGLAERLEELDGRTFD